MWYVVFAWGHSSSFLTEEEEPITTIHGDLECTIFLELSNTGTQQATLGLVSIHAYIYATRDASNPVVEPAVPTFSFVYLLTRVVFRSL
jgi:hypothetical protein